MGLGNMENYLLNILIAILSLKTFSSIQAATIQLGREVFVNGEGSNDDLNGLLRVVAEELSHVANLSEVNSEEMQNKIVEQLRAVMGKPRSPRQDDDGDGDGEGVSSAASSALGQLGNLGQLAGNPATVEGFLLSGITGSIFANLIPGDVGNTIKNIYAPINNFVEPFLKSLIGTSYRNNTATVQATTPRTAG